MPRPPMGRPGGGPYGPMVVEKPKNIKDTVKRLFRYIGANGYLLLILMGIMLIVTLLGLISPALQGKAIDTITLDHSKLNVDFQKLMTLLLSMVGIYLLSSLFTYFQGILSAKLSQKTVQNMRQDLFHKIERLPIRYFDTHQHGDIMSRMTNDVENISTTLSQSVTSLFSSAITIVGSLIMMLYYSPLLTLVSALTIPLTMLVTSKVSKYTRKYFVNQQRLLGRLNGHIEEMVTGYKTVAAFGREKQAVAEFDQIAGELKKTGIKAQIFGGVMGPLMNFINNISFLLIAGAGGYLALHNFITVGVIQAFILYSNSFTRPINEIANLYNSIQTAIAGTERVFEIMDTPPETDEGGLSAAKIEGAVTFDHIYFSYNKSEPVLKDFDLQVRPGEKIALVGATGAGKTTVVNLLTRFYDVDSGQIQIDGTDIRLYSKDSLRRSIAIVLQDTVLFTGTIADNIRYGRLDATMEEIVEAAKMANIHGFISRLPNGYQTRLSESGGNLSQGQRQLLSIARAILADPQILILDEATSSVDTRTEMHIGAAMIALMKNRTSFIIAHRLSTIRDADKIIVVDGGRIAETGTHDDLLAKGGCYYRLYQSQFSGASPE